MGESAAATIPPAAFDLRPLTDPVDLAEVKKLHLRLAGGDSAPAGAASRTFGRGCGLILIVFLLAIAVLIGAAAVTLGAFGITAIVSKAFTAQPLSDDADGKVFRWSAATLALCFLIGLVLLGRALARGMRRNRVETYRLFRFAEANGMTFEPRREDPLFRGIVFDMGRSALDGARVRNWTTTNIVRRTEPYLIERAFGGWPAARYEAGGGWWYAAIELPAPAPHIVLDSSKHTKLSGSQLPLTDALRQRLELADTTANYRIHCAPEDRDAARSLLSRDLATMLTSADAGAPPGVDIEIADSFAYFYWQSGHATDPRTWAWLAWAAEAMRHRVDSWTQQRAAKAMLGISDIPALPLTRTSAGERRRGGIPRAITGLGWLAGLAVGLAVVGVFAAFLLWAR